MKLSGKTALLVEGNQQAALVQKTNLENLNIFVLWAKTREQAVSFITSNEQIDFMIMSLSPDSEIRQYETTKEILEIRSIPALLSFSQNEGSINFQSEDFPTYGYLDQNANTTIYRATISLAVTLFETNQTLNKINRDLDSMLNQIQSFIDNAPVAITVLDTELIYISANKSFYDEYNIKIPNIVGSHLHEVFPEIPLHWKQVCQTCLQGEEQSKDFDIFSRADGTIDFIKWKIEPWYDENMKIAGVIIFSIVLNRFLEEYKSFEKIISQAANVEYMLQEIDTLQDQTHFR